MLQAKMSQPRNRYHFRQPLAARRVGFTLIELLVVVAIIALLIALIMPSLGRAREQAKLVRCAANLHAVGLAMASYNGQNQDLMPYYREYWLDGSGGGPVFNFGATVGWGDALYIDGDFRERTDVGGLGGVGGDGTKVDPSNDNYSYPAWGFGIMQCPNHSAQFQWDSSSGVAIPTDNRLYQGYGMAWCVGSGMFNKPDGSDGLGGPWSVYARKLNPGHIMVTEGYGSMGRTGSGVNLLPAHMGSGTTNSGLKGYGMFERHLRNTTYGANYLMADSHVEFSSEYGWATSPNNYTDGSWASANYKGPPEHNANANSRIWVHGASDN